MIVFFGDLQSKHALAIWFTWSIYTTDSVPQNKTSGFVILICSSARSKRRKRNQFYCKNLMYEKIWWQIWLKYEK